MLRKYFIVALFGLFMISGAAFAGAPTEAQEQAIAAEMAKMANEPPLTQADIDTFMKMLPKVEEVGNDPEAIFKLYQDNGVSPQRFAMIGTKMTVGMMMAQGVTREQVAASGQFLDFMIPSDDEIAIVKNNMEAILKAMGQ